MDFAPFVVLILIAINASMAAIRNLERRVGQPGNGPGPAAATPSD